MQGWFNNFEHWNGEAASLTRLVWLKCRGMPLSDSQELVRFKGSSSAWKKKRRYLLDLLDVGENNKENGRLTECKQQISEI